MKVPYRLGALTAAILTLGMTSMWFGATASAQSGAHAGLHTAHRTARFDRSSHRRQNWTRNPFILTRAQNHTRVQFMPTTAWIRKHQRYFSPATLHALGLASARRGVVRRNAEGTLASPACTLAIDNSPGDAKVVVSNTANQNDALDISAFGLNSNAANITATIQVESLTSGAGGTTQVSGGGDVWYVVWNYGTNPGIEGYFLSGLYPGTTNPTTGDFSYGTITKSATGGKSFAPTGTASGSLNTANDTITITTALANVGGPPVGAPLTAAYAEGDALVGAAGTGLLETADHLATNSSDYLAGDSQTSGNCPAAKPATSVNPGLPTAGDQGHNMTYYGGPVVHTIKNYLIFWLPKTATTGCPSIAPAEPTGTYTGASYYYEKPYGTNGLPGLPAAPPQTLPGGSAGTGDADYEGVLSNYFQDLGGTSFYNLLTQYADNTAGAVTNNQAFGGSWTDNCAYTSTPSPGQQTAQPAATASNPIYDADIQAEVVRAINANSWPKSNAQYFVFTGYGATSCFNLTVPNTGSPAPVCNTSGIEPTYCAYHGVFQFGSGGSQTTPVLYANMSDGAYGANPSTVNLCYSPPIGVTDPQHTVNENGVPVTFTDPIADAEVAITSHEQFETVTDEQVSFALNYGPPLAWYSGPNDQADGEIGDKCAYVYNNYAGDGSNINLHGDHYIVQTEWSNWDNGCALTPYQSNGGFGGATDTATIESGWNLLGIPASGISSTDNLKSDMERSGQLATGSVQAIGTFHDGRWTMTVPGYTAVQPINRTDGIFVLSGTAGSYTPSGTPYTSAPTITFNPGWSLVAATWPDPGVMTDSMYNEIDVETGACSAGDLLSNYPCSPRVSEVDALAGGKYIPWDAQSTSGTNAVWPQSFGNKVPFTNGMWVQSDSTAPFTWTPQGTQCLTTDPAGTTTTGGVCQ